MISFVNLMEWKSNETESTALESSFMTTLKNDLVLFGSNRNIDALYEINDYIVYKIVPHY